MPWLAKYRLVSSGYSVWTRTPLRGRSSIFSIPESAATASTTRIGRAVAFE